MMTIYLNDQPLETAQDTALTDVLAKQANDGPFAVAINGEFVPRTQYAATTLKDGDRLDVVSPVGGG